MVPKAGFESLMGFHRQQRLGITPLFTPKMQVACTVFAVRGGSYEILVQRNHEMRRIKGGRIYR